MLQSRVLWPLIDGDHGDEVADTQRDAVKQEQRELFVFGHGVGAVRLANLSLISANVYRNRLLPTKRLLRRKADPDVRDDYFD